MSPADELGKAWQDFEKFARETEIKKGMQIITLSPADVAKMKELAKPIVETAIEARKRRVIRRANSSRPIPSNGRHSARFPLP